VDKVKEKILHFTHDKCLTLLFSGSMEGRHQLNPDPEKSTELLA
jgi:hypothetical protein